MEDITRTYEATEFDGDVTKIRAEIRKLEKRSKSKATLTVSGTWPNGKELLDSGKKKMYNEQIVLDNAAVESMKTNWALVNVDEERQFWVRLDQGADVVFNATVPYFEENDAAEAEEEADDEDVFADGDVEAEPEAETTEGW